MGKELVFCVYKALPNKEVLKNNSIRKYLYNSSENAKWLSYGIKKSSKSSEILGAYSIEQWELCVFDDGTYNFITREGFKSSGVFEDISQDVEVNFSTIVCGLTANIPNYGIIEFPMPFMRFNLCVSLKTVSRLFDGKKLIIRADENLGYHGTIPLKISVEEHSAYQSLIDDLIVLADNCDMIFKVKKRTSAINKSKLGYIKSSKTIIVDSNTDSLELPKGKAKLTDQDIAKALGRIFMDRTYFSDYKFSYNRKLYDFYGKEV